MSAFRWTSIAGFLSCLLGPPLAGQSATVRASLDAFSDSLQSLATGEQVRSAERVAARPSPDDAASIMRLGLALLRRAQAEDGRYFDQARDAFRKAHELEPGWPYPLFAIGLAEGGKGDWLSDETLNLGTRVGHGAYRSAVQALIAAIDKDPMLTAAVSEVDRVATLLRDTVVDQQVLAAIRVASVAGNQHPSTLLILGRRERSAGRNEASIASFRQYLASGRDSSLAQYEIARSLLTGGNEAGLALYFAAAASDDSVTTAELRADLVPIAEDAELARYDVARGVARERFLRQFWENRGRRDLRTPSERLLEHFRRLRFAREQFVFSNNRRYHGSRDLYRAPKSETLDDRGVVYVRHGEPTQRIRPLMYGLLPNETWLYRRPDGDLLLHFSAGGQGFEGGDLSDYRLVPSVFSLRNNGTPQDLLLASRFEISDIYQKLMAWGPHGRGRMARAERDWGVRSAETGTQTDAFQLEFPRRLEGKGDLVTIGRRNGSSLLQVIYALPGVAAGSPVRLRLSLFDSLGGIRAWLDTIGVSVEIGGSGSGGRFELPVPPGKSYYRFALEVGEAGLVTARDSIEVPDLARSALSLSDIGFGQSTNHIKWVASPTDTALLTPGRDFVHESELQLYFEIYGLEARAPYRASVLVRDKRGQRVGRDRLRFTFQEEGQGEVTRIRRGIRLAGLNAGEYWLEVQIRDDGGGEVVTRKWLRVVSVAQ